MKKNVVLGLVVILLISTLSGCSNKSDKLKISATSVPHAELLEFVKDDLEEEGIYIEIIVTDDYSIPNRALSEGEVDLNFFQHYPYLEDQIESFDYDLEVVADIHIEPMGIYSNTIQSLDNIEEGFVIAVPNDATNEARALILLEEQGLIKLDESKGLEATIYDIIENPLNLEIIEVDAAMLPRTLEDVDLAVINTNYAIQADLNPLEDAIAIEDSESPYVNIVVARKGDENREDIQKIVEVLTSEKVRNFIEEEYNGAIVPVF